MMARSYDAALALDARVCAFLRERDGSRGSQWAGVSVRDDGRFGVFFSQECVDALGDNLPKLDNEVFTDGVSNWANYVPPAPDPERPL
jgi:hypothetical protein